MEGWEPQRQRLRQRSPLAKLRSPSAKPLDDVSPGLSTCVCQEPLLSRWDTSPKTAIMGAEWLNLGLSGLFFRPQRSQVAVGWAQARETRQVIAEVCRSLLCR